MVNVRIVIALIIVLIVGISLGIDIGCKIRQYDAVRNGCGEYVVVNKHTGLTTFKWKVNGDSK